MAPSSVRPRRGTRRVCHRTRGKSGVRGGSHAWPGVYCRPLRNRASNRRTSGSRARSWTEWPAPGTSSSWPSGASAASARAHGSGVDRSRSPDSSRIGTAGSSAAGAPSGTGESEVGGQSRQPWAKPLPVAVARSNGYRSAGGVDSASAESVATRCARSCAGSHGKAELEAQRALVQTLAQELRGDRFVAPDRGQERLEPAGTASAGSVQGVEHAGVMRRRHAVGDECVEHRGSVVEAPDDGGEVGSRIPSAAFGRAHRPQHGGATGKRRAVERIDARLRDDGVERHPRHVGGVLQRVALGHERAVGDAIERQPANPSAARSVSMSATVSAVV